MHTFVIAVQIDNEYSQNSDTGAYYAELEAKYLAGGIVVPLTYNDPGSRGMNFVNGTGAVNIYGVDSYPEQFDCANPDVWNPVKADYHAYHESTNPSEPFYVPEVRRVSLSPSPWAFFHGARSLPLLPSH